jgi:hypothetical protein
VSRYSSGGKEERKKSARNDEETPISTENEGRIQGELLSLFLKQLMRKENQ